MGLNSEWYEETPQGVILRLKIQPRAKKTSVAGLYGNPARLKIRLSAPPIDGKANEELLSFLKLKLGVTYSQLQLLRGQTSPLKDLLCVGVQVEKIKALIEKE